MKDIRVIFFTFLFVFIFALLPKPINAANVLTNPSFTGGSTNWTLSGNASYSATTYQDSAGSLQGHTAGRNTRLTGYGQQTISTSIIGNSTVKLNLYWAKYCQAVNCRNNIITVQVSYNGGTYQDVWTDTSTTPGLAMTSWSAVSNYDISSYFTSSGSYTIRLYFDIYSGNNKNANGWAWFDNLNLDVVPPNVTVGTTGTQISTIHPGESNSYMGGAFTFVRSAGSTTVSSITISETGTISDANISGLILYYKQEATCSSSIPVDATQFNSSAGTFSSGSSTVTGSMTVGTSQICIYLELDVSLSAGVGDTIELQITNPSTQVTVGDGTVSPATAVAISGTTTVTAAGVLAIDIVNSLDQSVSSPSVQFPDYPFNWLNAQSSGALGISSQKIKISNYSITHPWTLSIAATSGVSALWQSGTHSYDYNGLASEGRLYVNPPTATITPGTGCSNTGISTQSAAYFVSGSVNSINLVVASGSAQTECYWYVTGITLTQDIPARQPNGSYSIGMTLTII